MVSYSIKIKTISKCLNQTIKVYQNAVNYLIDIVCFQFDEIKNLSSKDAMMFIENLIHSTKNNLAKYPKFDNQFYKFPAYFRRSAISDAIGIVSAYKSQIENWEANGCNGKKPFLKRHQNIMPCFYNKGMFKQENGKFFIKIFRNNDYVWLEINLRKTDVDYINKNFGGLQNASSPTLEKVNHGYRLRFGFKPQKSTKQFVKDKDVEIAIGVDLGINTDATCSVVTKTGTVTGSKFINSPVEKDRLYTTLNRIKKCQRNGNKTPRRLWRFVNNYNTAIAKHTAHELVKYAISENADVIVFENLTNLRGSAHGRSKQKISIWRKKEIQRRTEELAARHGIRVAYICPYNTSKLAFDGSGEVLRGKAAGFTTNELCKFPNGKIYNCDLSASKNIAARYFIRAILKPLSEKKRLLIEAKVPEISKRTNCSLSSQIKLVAAMAS